MKDVIAPLRQKLTELALSGQLDTLLDSSRELLRASRQENAPETEAVALISLSQMHRIIGKFSEARLFVDGAHDIAKRLAHPRLLADALIERGYLALEGYSQPFEALDDFREALDTAHQNAEDMPIAQSLIGIAWAYQAIGEHDAALVWAKESISTAQDLSVPATLAQLWIALADIYRTQRRFGRAHTCLQHAQALISENNYTLLAGDALYQACLLHESPISQLIEAVIQPALSSTQRARYLETLAHFFAQERDFESAHKTATSYLEHAQKWHSKTHETIAFALLGYTSTHEGEYEQAQAHYAQALLLARESKNPYQEAGILESLGAIAFTQQAYDQALAHYQDALSVYRSLDYGNKIRALFAQVIVTHVARFIQQIVAFVRGER